MQEPKYKIALTSGYGGPTLYRSERGTWVGPLCPTPAKEYSLSEARAALKEIAPAWSESSRLVELVPTALS